MTEPFGAGGVPLVADTSAWARRRKPTVTDRWHATIGAGLIVACPVVSLELLAAARDGTDYDNLARALAALRQAPVTATVCATALGASRALVAGAGSQRRIPAADYLVAAAAAERGFGILHYDRDFDALAEVLGVESAWIAPPGALD